MGSQAALPDCQNKPSLANHRSPQEPRSPGLLAVRHHGQRLRRRRECSFGGAHSKVAVPPGTSPASNQPANHPAGQRGGRARRDRARAGSRSWVPQQGAQSNSSFLKTLSRLPTRRRPRGRVRRFGRPRELWGAAQAAPRTRMLGSRSPAPPQPHMPGPHKCTPPPPPPPPAAQIQPVLAAFEVDVRDAIAVSL
jgi:hypothetical protein